MTAFTRELRNIGKPYMQGADVLQVQKQLQAEGFYIGKDGADSAYGPDTAKAVKAYQLARALNVDGVVGTITWGALFKDQLPSISAIVVTFIDYATKQVKNKSIYVLGSQGQTGTQITEKWIKYREHNNVRNYTRAIALWKKRIAAGYKDLHAYDCSGLVIRFLQDHGLEKSDKTANGLYYDYCSAITRKTLQAGDLVFKKYATNSRMYHVGIYMGDGTVVHSKGRSDGVVRENINATGWNRYGRLKAFNS